MSGPLKHLTSLTARFVRSHLHSTKSPVDQQRHNAACRGSHANTHKTHTPHCTVTLSKDHVIQHHWTHKNSHTRSGTNTVLATEPRTWPSQRNTQVFQHTLWTSHIHCSKPINLLTAQTSWRISHVASVLVHFSPGCLAAVLVAFLVWWVHYVCLPVSVKSLHEMHVTSRMYYCVCVCVFAWTCVCLTVRPALRQTVKIECDCRKLCNFLFGEVCGCVSDLWLSQWLCRCVICVSSVSVWSLYGEECLFSLILDW